jgi:hypothetical protein
MIINCLAYSLHFWSENRDYVLKYNSDHVIAVPSDTFVENFHPIEDFGYDHVIKSFFSRLDTTDIKLLNEYFNDRKN